MTQSNSTPKFVIPLILAVAVVGLAAALMRQRSELAQTRAEYEQLLRNTQAQTSAGSDLRPSAAESDATPTPPAAAANDSAPPAEAAPPVASIPRSDDEVLTPTGLAAPPQWSGLSLAGTHVTPHEGGLRATMNFYPTQGEPLGIVAVVVRLPRNSESRILDLAPTGAVQFSNVTKNVSADGKFAIWHGTAGNAESMELALTVTGETVADVRGTAGIGPFELEISPLEAMVRPK